jgi:CHAD domain-containing protein
MDAPETVARFRWPEGLTPSRVLSSLARSGYGPRALGRGSVRDLLLDTQDGTLAKMGARLALSRRRTEILWRFEPPSGPAEEGPGGPEPESWPMGTAGRPLPPGAFAALEGAPLFPVACLDLTLREEEVSAPDGSRLALAFEALRRTSAPYGGPTVPLSAGLLTLRLVEGEAAEVGHLAVYLRDHLGFALERRDRGALALEALGRTEPGGHAPRELLIAGTDTLAVAARKVVGQQLLKIRANSEGTLLDLDPEYLHDMRVGTRRLRSALRVFGPALGTRRAESLRLELGWLARLLGEVRDLDVFIAGLHGQAARLGEAKRIAETLERELVARRAPALEALQVALRGRRYEALLRRVAALAASTVPKRPGGPAALTAAESAPPFLAKAHKRVVKQGRLAVPSGEAPALHRLRILFKRLRYASEFFAPAVGERLDPLIKAMVRFQDCLGEHQDAVVAAGRIEALARELAARGDLPVESLLDLGGLIQVQREIARARRDKLAGLWAQFDRASVKKCLAAPAAEGVDPLKPSP